MQAVAQCAQTAESGECSSQPAVGDEAAGHGMSGRIEVVPGLQPLAAHDIWRVVLEGQPLVHVVSGRVPHAGPRWRLLAMGDMTDEQLDAYEAAISEAEEAGPSRGPAPGF